MGVNRTSAVVSVALFLLVLTLSGDSAEGIRYSTSRGISRSSSQSSCSAYYQAYVKLRNAIRTCTNVNNYGCRITTGSTWAECNFTCISIVRWCDGIVDCPLGDDELNCPTTTTSTTTTTTTTTPTTTTTTPTTTSTTTTPPTTT